MKKDLVELVFILDKSGSMNGLEGDTIGGYNSLLEKQKKEEGDALITTILFDKQMQFIHQREDIDKVSNLTEKEYYASGCTALLDSIGNALSYIQNEQNKLDEEAKPEKTLFVITTDGKENASKEYSYKQIKNMIENSKKEKNYEFLFLGANIDAISEANKLGIDKDNSVTYTNDSEGVLMNYQCLETTITKYRRGKVIDKSWKKKIEDRR